jgi:hypothetical protein
MAINKLRMARTRLEAQQRATLEDLSTATGNAAGNAGDLLPVFDVVLKAQQVIELIDKLILADETV